MSIKVLTKKVVDRIAAGEVVERPASVVKELVENSLDAGASQISIEVGGGGISLIRITDNGIGIPPDEVELAFERHATSKIDSFEDLDSLHSLGFRGEALPSIAAVADVEILTCAEGEAAGTFISLEDGTVTGKKSQARSQGTTLAVRNLFRRVPARLKFLKSLFTEASHIANVVSQYALSFPEVKFSLLIDGKATLRTAGSGRLLDSVVEVYGAEVAASMLELDGVGRWGETSPDIQVTGMAGSPSVSRSNRGYLSFFVNRRWINSRLLGKAVEEAYHGLLMVGKYPVAIINISLPQSEVDVNIHPTKTEVKFRNEHAVFSVVQKAVRQALVEQSPVPRIESPAPAYAPVMSPKQSVWPIPAFNSSPRGKALPMTSQPLMSLSVLRILGQLMNSYIVAEGSDGLYLIDQHAAHERILFEKVNGQRLQQAVEVQGLLEPATISVSPRQETVLKSRYEELTDYGFAIEPFGDRTYLVRTVPAVLHGKDWMIVLLELLDSEVEEDKDRWQERMAVSIACHSAVKAGEILTDVEMRELIRQLEQAVSPRTCPHGRPTMMHLSFSQLEREFGRA